MFKRLIPQSHTRHAAIFAILAIFCWVFGYIFFKGIAGIACQDIICGLAFIGMLGILVAAVSIIGFLITIIGIIILLKDLRRITEYNQADRIKTWVVFGLLGLDLLVVVYLAKIASMALHIA